MCEPAFSFQLEESACARDVRANFLMNRVVNDLNQPCSMIALRMKQNGMTISEERLVGRVEDPGQDPFFTRVTFLPNRLPAGASTGSHAVSLQLFDSECPFGSVARTWQGVLELAYFASQ